MTTGLVWDERFFWYDFGDYRSLLGGHPWLQPGSFAETSESKRRILNLLHASGLMDALTTLAPVAVDEQELCCFHTEDYVRRVQSLSASGGGTVSRGAPVPAGGCELAALAAGGTRTARISSPARAEARRWLTGQIPHVRAVSPGISQSGRPSQNRSKPRNSTTWNCASVTCPSSSN